MEKSHLLLLRDIMWFRSSASRSIFSASRSHRINKMMILFRKATWNTMLLCMCLNIIANPPSSVICQWFQSLFPRSAFSCFALLVWNFSQWKLFFSFQLIMPSQTEPAKIKSVRSSNFSPPFQLVWQECEGVGRRLQSMHQHILRPSRPGDSFNVLTIKF